MRRPPTARPADSRPRTTPRPAGRAAPIIYRPHAPAPRPGDAHPNAAGPPAQPLGLPALPAVATWLTADERLRVDAAGHGVFAAVHHDALAPLAHALGDRPHEAAIVSVAMLARGGRAAGEALAALLRHAPTLPTAALVSGPVDLATVLALGRAGIRAVVDVRSPDGWATLRAVVAASARPDVARLAARALAPVVAPCTPDVQRFVAALFEAPARVVTVRDLARGLGVLPTTLMSRFFRAALPPPKRYLAFARLTRAAHLLHTPAWTVAAVADHLEYSSAQGFSRHLHLLLGMRPAEFRRRYDGTTMLARFCDELLHPFAAVLRDFWPLRSAAQAARAPAVDPGAAIPQPPTRAAVAALASRITAPAVASPAPPTPELLLAATVPPATSDRGPHHEAIVGLSAVDIAARVRDGRLTPTAVVAAHLAHAAGAAAGVDAFRTLRTDEALAEADALARRPDLATLPLAGVPVAVKDNLPVAGTAMRLGTRATPPNPQPRDHEVVRRLRAAGAIVLGLTHVPELCIWPFTDGPLGTARNPWNPDRTAGGSSGGSAAAVAAAAAPIAVGNDGLGSIRIPAAACGLVGVKPGTGLVPSDIGDGSWFGYSENGPLATTVDDAALMLAVLAGRADLAHPAAESTTRLRVALSTRAPAPGVRVDPACADAARQVAALLERAGHQVARRDPPAGPADGLHVIATWGLGAAGDRDALVAAGADPTAFEPRTHAHARMGRALGRLGLGTPAARARLRARLVAFFADVDVLVTPTLARTAVAAAGWPERGWRASVATSLAFAPFTGAWNAAGLPALTLPVARAPDGLPIGVQLVGPAGSEARLLDLARAVERALPWPRHPPGAIPTTT
jgi:amidase